MKTLIINSVWKGGFGAVLLALVMSTGFAAPNSSGEDSMKDVCGLSGGDFFGDETDYWSCCWAGWGCYQCITPTNCTMVCESAACRDANASSTLPPKRGYTKIKGIAPAGVNAPIVPVKPRKFFKVPMSGGKVND